MKSLVIGVVGNGFAASFHQENYRRVYDVDIRIKGVASRTAEGAQDFADRH